ncbi:carbonic anhydrase [Luteibaculum oceani]|uniref:Carbonic anhydrase 2 n=1 Tax=Luteibaculum oceani TaxID=1294296 RepID=A0A5C6USW0_9FLAO|nr:carbonic anhydrase [Luteibaculum oceani]TXC76069.1 carbonic anhydrase [Luteibaculum oceani]
MDFNKIFEKNANWVKDKLNLDNSYFETMSKGQSPEVLYIGCSDSRVTAEEMMGAGPGEVFVHRNIANMVVNTDLSSISVINYAVNHLKVKHVVVCGHYFCGGVKAAMSDADLGPLNPWLRNIRDVYRLHKSTLDAIADEDARYNKLIELNVHEQCMNLMKNEDVLRAVEKGAVEVHGWVFDIKSGKIVDLKIDVKGAFSDLKNIYKLA